VRALRLLLPCAALLLLATGCVTGGDKNTSSNDPTPGPQFAIVTLTPIPPGATIMIEPTATIDPTTLRRHTIKDGESLSSIASDYGVSQEALQTLNNIDDPNSIQVGQELLIPPS
jgi:LysM domain